MSCDVALNVKGMKFASALVMGCLNEQLYEKREEVKLCLDDFFPQLKRLYQTDSNSFMNSLLQNCNCDLFACKMSSSSEIGTQLVDSVASFDIPLVRNKINILEDCLSSVWQTSNLWMHSGPSCLVLKVLRGSAQIKKRGGVILNELHNDILTYPSTFDLREFSHHLDSSSEHIYHLHAVIARKGKFVEMGHYNAFIRNYGYRDGEYPSNLNTKFTLYHDDCVCGVAEALALRCTGKVHNGDEIRLATTFVYISEKHMQEMKEMKIDSEKWKQVYHDLDEYTRTKQNG